MWILLYYIDQWNQPIRYLPVFYCKCMPHYRWLGRTKVFGRIRSTRGVWLWQTITNRTCGIVVGMGCLCHLVGESSGMAGKRPKRNMECISLHAVAPPGMNNWKSWALVINPQYGDEKGTHRQLVMFVRFCFVVIIVLVVDSWESKSILGGQDVRP